MRAAEELEPLDDQELSQRNLADVLAGMQDGSYAERLMPLLSPDDLAGTEPGMLRDGSVSFPVVREEDLPSSWNGVTRAELIRLTIPMLVPKSHDIRRWPRLRGMAVAPEGSIHYDPMKGARWQN